MRMRSSLCSSSSSSASAAASSSSSSSSSWLTVFCLLWLVNSGRICTAASLELSEGGSPSSAASHRNRLLSALLSYHGDDAIILELPVSIVDDDPPEVVMISDDRHWLPVLETEVPLDGRLMEEGQHLQQQQQQRKRKRRQRMMGHAVARRTFDTLGGAEIPWIY